MTFPCGAKHPNAKLTAAKVRLIRTYRQRGMSLRALAKRFDVSHMAIKNVIDGVTWKV